jgi:hypothetical protein
VKGARSSLQTRIVAMESGSLCTPMKSWLRFWNWKGRFASTYWANKSKADRVSEDALPRARARGRKSTPRLFTVARNLAQADAGCVGRTDFSPGFVRDCPLHTEMLTQFTCSCESESPDSADENFVFTPLSLYHESFQRRYMYDNSTLKKINRPVAVVAMRFSQPEQVLLRQRDFFEHTSKDKEQVARLTGSPWPRSDQALAFEQWIRFRPLELSRLHA